MNNSIEFFPRARFSFAVTSKAKCFLAKREFSGIIHVTTIRISLKQFFVAVKLDFKYNYVRYMKSSPYEIMCPYP